MPENYYDSERAASEYLLLHYGDPRAVAAMPFPARCVTECLDAALLPRTGAGAGFGMRGGGRLL